MTVNMHQEYAADLHMVITPFAPFLKDKLAAGNPVSFVPISLKEVAEVERDWPNAVEYAVACLAESEEAWVASACAAVSLCGGNRLDWVAEQDGSGIRWLPGSDNLLQAAAAVITEVRIRRLRVRDLMPMHLQRSFAGFVMVFTIGMKLASHTTAVERVEIVVDTDNRRASQVRKEQ